MRPLDPAAIDSLIQQVVGRRREVEVTVAALAAGRDLVLEGPPGTGKTTLLRALADQVGIGLVAVEGTAELTPARLLGHHDPSRVLQEGYVAEVFVDGPLLRAMRAGSMLYVEEINRVPEETLNVLVGAMSARAVVVPRLGEVRAAAGFVVAAAMNPYDTVGTARISAAVSDRTCRVAMGYQSAADELAIVTRRVAEALAATADPGSATGHGAAAGALAAARADVPAQWSARVVELVRRTREHPDLRVGASVRGAIDMALVAERLACLRGGGVDEPGTCLDAALAALSGRVRPHDTSAVTAEDVVRSLWQEVFGADATDGQPPGAPGKAPAPEA